MRKNPASQSGIFNPRVLVACVLCSVGALLAMLSLAATTPAEAPRANTSVPPDPANFRSTGGSNANQLPPGVPLPPGAQFSANGQGDPSSSSPTSPFKFLGFAGTHLQSGTADLVNSVVHPGLTNQQLAPSTMQQATSSQSSPLAAAAQSDWSIVSSPNTNTNATDNNFLEAVTCVSASDCWAVGLHVDRSTGIQKTLIERWDGTSWAIVSSPNASTTRGNFLYGVTCTSASDCWGVGYYDVTGSGAYQTLIERWDGTSWAIVSSPNTSATQRNYLKGVTCTSASDCWAVGFYYVNGSGYQTLIEHWDGSAWTIIASPDNNATGDNLFDNLLYGVTCTSASDCWAVGYYLNSSVYQTLIERWDGSAWAIVTSANTNVAQHNYLNGVTCVSESECWAVGFYDSGTGTGSALYQTLIERWDGTSWAIVSSPNTSATKHNVLYGVTCVSASDCWAVGYYFTGSAFQTLFEHWDGTSWAVVTSPSASSPILNSVTCASASDCWTIGYYYAGALQTLIEHWDGTSWAIVTSPNAGATQSNTLYGVTCASASQCWAVGYFVDATGTTYQTLIEHWDGTSWTIVSSPNATAANDNFLTGVTCVSASDCWAVGYNLTITGIVVTVSTEQALIEHWDGTSWAIVSSPNIGVLDNVLNGVTCASASECWAVGYSIDATGTTSQTLIEHWDGTLWTIVSSPNTNTTQTDILSSVTCASAASDCWAVGYYVNANGTYQTLIERWDGTSWAIVSSPNVVASTGNYLYGVTCASALECWAVGYSVDATGTTYQTLIERWDGTLWTIVTSPNTNATQNNYLSGVTCAAASDCWTVGYYLNGSAYQALIEHWDGTSWAIVTSPNIVASTGNYLYGVTCVSASDCWAIGYYSASAYQTLIEHYGPPVQLASVVSRKTHGSAGTFDVNLPLSGNPGIECRSGGANGDYTLVFTFANPLTSVGGASITSGTGTVSGSAIGSDAHQYIVNLTGVTNAQVITISLANVNDSAGDRSSVIAASMGVLLGDVTGNGLVNSSDIAQTQAQSGQAVTSSNFREDVNANGLINSTDVSLVQSKSGTGPP